MTALWTTRSSLVLSLHLAGSFTGSLILSTVQRLPFSSLLSIVNFSTAWLKFDCSIRLLFGTERPLDEAIAELIAANRLRRNEVFIITKPAPANHGRGLVLSTLRRSLALLQTTYVDCLMLHHTDEESEEDFKDVWRQMEEAVDLGLARSLGLRADSLSWESSQNIAGLCNGCTFFFEAGRKQQSRC